MRCLRHCKPLTDRWGRIEIPPLVYEHNLKVEPSITLSEKSEKRRVFGIALSNVGALLPPTR